MANSDASSPNWRGGKGTPQRKLKKQEWQQPGQPLVSSEGMGRKLRIAGYLGGVLACVAGIILWIWLITPPRAPLFVIVANPPEVDAASTDVPLDLYGWKGASLLAEWIGAARKSELANETFLSRMFKLQNTPNQVFDSDKPLPLTQDPTALLANIEQYAVDSKYIVVYFGVMGNVNDKGEPLLYTSNGGPLTVRNLIKEFDRPAFKGKNIILMFDAARLHYAPRLGILHNDFARKLKELHDSVKRDNLVILCSSSEDELAWDSEQAGSSVFLYQLMQLMKQGEGASKAIELQSLFDSIKSSTVTWTKDRCITEQTPVMFGNVDAIAAMKLPAISAKLPDPSLNALSDGSRNTALADSIRNRLADAEKLARQIPGPEVYTPLRWRYYRELLSRWEKAALSHHGPTVDLLAAKLDTLRKEMESDRALQAGKSLNTTLSMKAFLTGNYAGPGHSADPASLSRELIEFKNLDDAPFRKPVEAQLAEMMNAFFKDFAITPDKELLEKTLHLRLLAEKHALSLLGDEKQYSYSERIWPLIHAKIVAADALRRQGEDLLFASGDKQRTDARFNLEAALKAYQQATSSVAVLQEAWRTYHYAASVLPDLAQWRSEMAALHTRKDALSEDWLLRFQQCHEPFLLLQDKLKDLTEENLNSRLAVITQSTIETRDALKKFLAEYQQIVDDKCSNREEKYNKECVLRIPLLVNTYKSGNDSQARLEALKSARKKGDDFFAKSDASTTEPVRIQFSKLAQLRVRLWYSLLKPADKDKVNTLALDELSRHFDAIKSLWQDMPVSGKDTDKLADFEAHSRMVLTPREYKQVEPAVLVRTAQWNRVLKDHAMRFALDHWYRADKQPYFRELAEACLADVKPTPGVAPADDSRLKNILSAESLSLQSTGLSQANQLQWTSEQEQDLQFSLQHIPPVPGAVTAWQLIDRKSDKPSLQIKNNMEKVRQSRELQGKDMPPLTLSLQLAEQETGSKDETVKATQHVYFRGQRLAQSVDVDLFRQPSRIVTWQKPTENATFVVNSTGDLGIGLGHLVIVLDYSGSMMWSDKQKMLLTKWPESEAEREETRLRKAINTFDGILSQLPHETQISVYVFSDSLSTPPLPPSLKPSDWAPLTKQIACRNIVTGTLSKQGDTVVLQTKNGTRTKADLLKSLRELKPMGFTPLIQSTKTAILENRSSSEAMTLLILTDGMDTSEGDLTDDMITPEEQKQRVNLLSSQFENLIKETTANLHMVFFQAKSEELKLAKSVFDLSAKDQFAHRVKIHRAEDTDQLKEALLDALRPRIRLLKDGVSYFDNKYGWEISPNRTKIDRMKCTPAIVPGMNYELSVGNARTSATSHQGQNIGFRPGDFMFLELSSRKGPGQVQIARKLFKDVFIQDKDQREQQGVIVNSESPPWHVCLAENQDKLAAHDGQKYRSFIMTLENSTALQAENGRLQLPATQPYTWWDVEFRDASNKPLPRQPRVQVRNITRYFAPAWELHFDELDSSVDNMFVTVWPEKEEFQEPPPRPIILRNCRNVTQKHMGKYQVRCFHVASYQKYDARFGRATTPVEALAVQVQLPSDQPWKPLQLELVGAGHSVNYIEHVYYQKARSVTVYFCGVSRDEYDKLEESAMANLISMKNVPPITLKLTRQQALQPVIGNTMLAPGVSKDR